MKAVNQWITPLGGVILNENVDVETNSLEYVVVFKGLNNVEYFHFAASKNEANGIFSDVKEALRVVSSIPWTREKLKPKIKSIHTCIECPEFHQLKFDEDYGYCPMSSSTVRGDDPVCDDGAYFIMEGEEDQ